jgi:glycerol-3-phosphate dehydrogenase
MANGQLDLVIVGGGISGACILWDATLRGASALLLEKNDFASGTTQATSKLIHGGLRYLKNLEFGLVRESLRERRLLARLAPHALKPMPFLHPIYSGAKPGRLLMGIALWLYDLLSFDRNRGVPEHLRLPGHKWLSRSEALRAEPGLNPEGLQGAYIYYDYQNLNPERLCSDFIFSAVEKGAVAKNYVEVTGIRFDMDQQNYIVAAQDRLTKETFQWRARSVVNAAGPWADLVDRSAAESTTRKIIRSMGIHLVTRKIAGDRAVALHRKDGTHFFIIPWRNHSLIGTTDCVFEGSPDQFKIPEEQIQGLIADVSSGLATDLKREDVEVVYGGLRPLVEDAKSLEGGSYSASRKTEIEAHPNQPGFFTVLGGKYTTSRELARKAMDSICSYLAGSWRKARTEITPLRTGDYESQLLLKHKLLLEKKYDRTRIETLVNRYGLLAERILARHDSGDPIVLSNGEICYPEEIGFILENEGVRRVDDLLLRRTGLATAGDAVRHRFAEIKGRIRFLPDVRRTAFAG